jgi:hypothetical protein
VSNSPKQTPPLLRRSPLLVRNEIGLSSIRRLRLLIAAPNIAPRGFNLGRPWLLKYVVIDPQFGLDDVVLDSIDHQKE